jgi:hypothetical protein
MRFSVISVLAIIGSLTATLAVPSPVDIDANSVNADTNVMNADMDLVNADTQATGAVCCSKCPKKTCGRGKCCVSMSFPEKPYCGNGPLIVRPNYGRCISCTTKC